MYGYRVHGPYDPAAGHSFNPNKIVLDPYAKSIGHPVQWDDSMFGYTVGYGFTLQDLVSYNDKHNEGNGDGNQDGENNNLSWNCGVEGPTGEPALVRLREQQKRNLMASLLLSLGVPMILLNAHRASVAFSLPTIGPNTAWVRILDTIAAHVRKSGFPARPPIHSRAARWRCPR